MTTIVERQASKSALVASALGANVEIVASIDALRHHLDERPDEFAVVIGSDVDLTAAVSLSENLRVSRPALGVILLRQRVDSSVLADALRSGMREVVEERDLTGVASAVRRAQGLYQALVAGRPGQNEREAGRLVTVFSAKGGVGKTTVSTNLAVTLSTLGRRVCLVDLDLAFGDVAITLKLFPERSISEVLAVSGNFEPEDLQPLLTPYSDQLSTLLAPASPDPNEEQLRAIAGKVLVALKQMFDYVVVDTPPAFDDQVLQAFDESDLMLLVLTPDIPALKNVKLTLEMLELLNHPVERIRVILNRADAKVGLSQQDIEKALKFTISATVPAAPEVSAAINRGEPVVVALPRHPASLAFADIARDLLHNLSGPGVGQGDLEPVAVGGPERRRTFHRRSKSA
jgi:pilus assembly protein CpaE